MPYVCYIVPENISLKQPITHFSKSHLLHRNRLKSSKLPTSSKIKNCTNKQTNRYIIKPNLRWRPKSVLLQILPIWASDSYSFSSTAANPQTAIKKIRYQQKKQKKKKKKTKGLEVQKGKSWGADLETGSFDLGIGREAAEGRVVIRGLLGGFVQKRIGEKSLPFVATTISHPSSKFDRSKGRWE